MRSFLADPFRDKLDNSDMVIKLSQEKYRISDKMFLIYGIESEEFDVAARYYGLETD